MRNPLTDVLFQIFGPAGWWVVTTIPKEKVCILNWGVMGHTGKANPDGSVTLDMAKQEQKLCGIVKCDFASSDRIFEEAILQVKKFTGHA